MPASSSSPQLLQSPRFTEFAIALPDALRQAGTHPLIVQLTERLQASIYEQNEATSDIAYAKQILDTLTQTDIADASVLIVLTDEAEPKLMLTRRAGHLNAHAGEVSFAGGKHEASDGNNVVTALRETCEETALPPSKVKLLGQLPPQTSKAGLSVRPIVALADPDVIYVPELGEIERIFWADLATLIDAPTQDYKFEYTQGEQTATLVTLSWLIDSEVVWGLTGRILADLLKVGFDREIDWYLRAV